METIVRYLEELQGVLGALPLQPIRDVVDLLVTANSLGSTVFTLGNGGSAATASHLACDLAKFTIMADRPRFRVMALTDNLALMTAWSNDVSYDEVFAAQLENLVRPNDVVIAISGSGNSPNVLRAVETAHRHGAVTVGFSGFSGGKLGDLVDLPVVVPSESMQQIEDVHLVLSHLICVVLREELRQLQAYTLSAELSWQNL